MLWNYYTTSKDILIMDQSKFSILIRLSQLFTQSIKAENPEQSVVYLTILWLECGSAFRGSKCSITCFTTPRLVNAKIFKLRDSR